MVRAHRSPAAALALVVLVSCAAVATAGVGVGAGGGAASGAVGVGGGAVVEDGTARGVGVAGGGPATRGVRGVVQPETDNTVTRIELRADGDARWTLRIRTRLDGEGDVRDYRAFQERFRANTSAFRDPFAGRMAGVVESAARATGREMDASTVTVETTIQEVPRRWGVVSYSFTWTNFAATDGAALVVGDVFEGGLFLAANDTLTVVAPPAYAVVDARPAPAANESGTVTWRGQEEFADGRPHVRVAPAATPTASPTPTRHVDGGPPTAVLGGVVLLALLGLGAAVAVRRSGGGLSGLFARGGRDDRGGRDGPGPGGDAGTGGGTPAVREQGPDAVEPVLTDAERVERLLADAGGRMRQADVAEVLDWSASKTSRVVNDMAEAGRVEKLRIGRENVLELRE